MAPAESERIQDCRIYKIGRFQQFDSRTVAHFALNIREKGDVTEETLALMESLVGDGAVIVATPHHCTLLVPAFSEYNIFAWRTERDFVLFDSIQKFREFASLSRISLELDGDQLSQYLASDRINNRQTAFIGLEEIEHSCSLTILSDNNESLVTLNHLPGLIYRSNEGPKDSAEAVAEVRALTIDAIRAKSSPEMTGIATSGGFDSSLLALLHIREFPESVPFLYHVHSSRVPGLNEIEYFNDVRARCDHHVRWLDAEDTRDTELSFPHMVPAFRPPMVAGWFERNWRLYDAARSDSVEVLLNGDGGDQLMLCLDEMSLLNEFHKEGVPFARSAINEAFIRQSSVWDVLRRSLSKKSNTHMLRWICYDQDNVESVLPFLKMKEVFPKETSESVNLFSDLSVSRRFQICTLNDAKYNVLATSMGVTERKPFLYWPLIRFCVSCPRSLMYAGGRERGLFRAAFSDVLPRSIANRVGKAGDVDVSNLFNYGIIKKKVVASEIISDLIDIDAVSAIDTDNLSEEAAGFLMRCATTISFLKQFS